MPDQPEPGIRTLKRRRRTRRHRRNRLVRRILFALVVVALGAGISAITLRYLSPSVFRASKSFEPDRQASETSRARFLEAQQDALRSMDGRKIYPYSVVPGGVRDARELKWATDHDPVVAAHYRGFDYDNARVVRLVLARTVYVSYRIGNKIYWTRHRVKLKKGETVITDGKMTARTRCANRVEELPRQATSSSEPPAMKFEQPVMPSLGPATENLPLPFVSSLISPPGVGPSLPLSTYSPFQTGIWIPIYPPPLPGVCGVGKKKIPDVTKRKGGNPCGSGSGGGVVPEPSTWLLVVSGLSAICWISRRRLRSRRTNQVL